MPSRARSSLVAIGILAIAAPVAVAAGGGVVEPHASSPAGAVYEIPLQTARRDAAPRDSSGGGGSGKTNGVTPAAGNSDGGGGAGGGGVLPQGSDVKSENGFGSSSKVPGLPTHKATAARASVSIAKASSALGVSAPDIQTKPASGQIPSTGASYLLIAMLVVAGIATGLVAGGAVRRGLH